MIASTRSGWDAWRSGSESGFERDGLSGSCSCCCRGSKALSAGVASTVATSKALNMVANKS